MSQGIKISVTIITLNEEKKIERCLQSVRPVADEIVVVDSFSDDGTESICLRYGARFIKNPFSGYIAQKNFAVEQATYDHVLSLDADEALSDALRSSILKVKTNWGDCDGYAANRLNNYCGKWIRHCGWYPDRKIRLWDRRKAVWGGTDPHDIVQINSHRVIKLKGDILHFAYFTVDEHLLQMHRFGVIAARAKYAEGKKSIFVIHVLLNPIFKFLKKYFLQLGFLDGYYGFVFCAAASSLNFFKYLRLYEYNRRGLPESEPRTAPVR
jgi:glycosyltransferase involved in cell wall biosynthesis